MPSDGVRACFHHLERLCDRPELFSVYTAEGLWTDPHTSAQMLRLHLDVDVPGDFDLVLLAMCDYCALGPDQRRQLLGRVGSWLRPGGRFVFDVNGMRRLREREDAVVYAPDLMDGFWSSGRYHGFRHTFVYREQGRPPRQVRDHGCSTSTPPPSPGRSSQAGSPSRPSSAT